MSTRSPNPPDPPEDGARASSRSRVALRFDLIWESDGVHHSDSLVMPRIDLARDRLPPALKSAVVQHRVGHRAEIPFEPGSLLPDWSIHRALQLQPEQFNRRFLGLHSIEPRVGRFYPKGMLLGVRNLSASDRSPFRVGNLSAKRLVADMNHPLAGKRLTLGLKIDGIWNSEPRIAARGSDLGARLYQDGPGMQGRWGGLPTDFFSDDAFARLDEADDSAFYAQPRLVDHLDSTAIAEISSLYGRLIPPGSRILDLMTSWHSHLPDTLAPASVTGLGMNPEELARNPALSERVVHDLNNEPRLPFSDACFDAVICTVSVEYLTRPVTVFQELARVLTPGGVAIMTFSNRWFPPKVIRLWEQLHEFERPGLVLEYFRRSVGFRDLRSWSLRGHPRPADDRYAHRLPTSDPVHAVWAVRAGERRIRL